MTKRTIVHYRQIALVALPVFTAEQDEHQPWQHSTLILPGVAIRDDTLANSICDSIPKDRGRSQIHDIAIFIDSCHAGGMIDEFSSVFGEGGACQGVPYVIGTSCMASQSSYGWSDDIVNGADHVNKKLGSTWTSALFGPDASIEDADAGAARRGHPTDAVADDLDSARTSDFAGPNGAALQSPQIATGNGGESITWTAAKSHVAVIFEGFSDFISASTGNNKRNTAKALSDLWEDAEGKVSVSRNGNEREDKRMGALLSMIEEAGSQLDSDTQLVIYLTGLGDSQHDALEKWFYDQSLPVERPMRVESDIVIEIPLEEDWWTQYDDLPFEPTPTIDLFFLDPVMTQGWIVSLNENEFALPSFTHGLFDAHPTIDMFNEGINYLELKCIEESCAPLPLAGFELSSGPCGAVLD